MNLELLYLDGCSSWHQTLENLRQALRWEGEPLKVSLVRVVGARHARTLGMHCCPTIRLDQQELFPQDAETAGLVCRLFRTLEGLSGSPTVQMIRQQLHALGVNKNPNALGSVAEASPAL
ncbi:MAG TPA: thioredoxin family protein [Dehalococcoidia bacterium]|nr:thioredoxin family protein [Dehalococcoidia bacterium]